MFGLIPLHECQSDINFALCEIKKFQKAINTINNIAMTNCIAIPWDFIEELAEKKQEHEKQIKKIEEYIKKNHE